MRVRVSEFPWHLPHHAAPLLKALKAAAGPLALLLAKLLMALRVLLEAGVLWKALQRTGEDMQGFAESVPRTLRLFHWVIQVRHLCTRGCINR